MLLHTRCCAGLENATGGWRVTPGEGLPWGHWQSGREGSPGKGPAEHRPEGLRGGSQEP